MKKVVYVTGCLGFIGSYITRACLNRGWYVRGVDKVTYAANPDFLEEFSKYDNFIFEKIDINDLDRIYDCDYFINSAAETHVQNSIRRSEEFIHSNIHGVYHILELLRKNKIDKTIVPTFFSISTDEVYGDILDGSHLETDMIKPSNPYSASKAAGDMMVLAWNRTYKLPYIILRPTNNYGEGQYVEKLIPLACKNLLLGKKIPLHDRGEPYRNWLHASDTAEAVINIIEHGIQNETFNVSGGFEQKNIDTVRKIINCWLNRDINEKLSNDEYDKYLDFSIKRPGQDVRYSLNDDKLKKLAWNPIKQFDDELPSIINYYRNRFIW